MAASYPTSIKSFTTKVDDVDDVLAEHVNSLQEEVVAIETALGINPKGVVQVVHAEVGGTISGSTAIPNDDTAPTWAEGDDTTIVGTITPTDADNILLVVVHGSIGGTTSQSSRLLTLFKDPTGTDECIRVACELDGIPGGTTDHLTMIHKMVAGGVSATSFKLRFGADTGTQILNAFSAATDYGGKSYTTMTIFEIKV